MSILSRSTTLLFVLLALCSHTVSAHTYLSAVFLNNKKLEQGDCVRPHPQTAFDFPLPSVNAADMTCGWLPSANNPANRKCPVAAGSTIGIQWHHNHNGPSDDIIEYTHKGPVMMYLAKSDTGAGNVWFKIYEDGLVNGQWGVDRLIANKGRVDFTIPADIAPGNYLLRGEVIALHSAYDVNGAQPYVGCVELTITGSGSATPAGVAFPGYYKNTDPGMLISIYQTVRNYVIPGPAVYKSGSAPPTPGSSTSAPAPTNKPETAPTMPSTPTPVYPTYPPSNGGADTLKVGVNNVNDWWAGITVSGGGETTVKVEIKDYSYGSTYAAMLDQGYAYTHSFSSLIKLPLSIRLTSSSGKQVELPYFVTARGPAAAVDTWMSYSSSAPSTQAPTVAPTTKPTVPATAAPTVPATAAPTVPVTAAPTVPVTAAPTVPVTAAPTVPATAAPTVPATAAPTTPATAAPTVPATAAPTVKPTSAPTNAPSSGEKVNIKLLDGSNGWWFSVAVSGIDASTIKSVELKDSDKISSFKTLEATWESYTFINVGFPAVAPYYIRVTKTDGSSATATFSSFAPQTQVEGSF